MLKQIEGSRAVAEVVAMCRPNVISAYPITPQTTVVEKIAELGVVAHEGGLGAAHVVDDALPVELLLPGEAAEHERGLTHPLVDAVLARHPVLEAFELASPIL